MPRFRYSVIALAAAVTLMSQTGPRMVDSDPLPASSGQQIVLLTGTDHSDGSHAAVTLRDGADGSRRVIFGPIRLRTIYSIDVSPDGQWMTYADQHNVIRLINLRSKAQRSIGRANDLASYSPVGRGASFSPDGRYLAFSDNRYVIHVLDLRSRRMRTVGPGISQDWSADSRFLAVGNNKVYIYSLLSLSLRGVPGSTTECLCNGVTYQWSHRGHLLTFSGGRKGISPAARSLDVVSATKPTQVHKANTGQFASASTFTWNDRGILFWRAAPRGDWFGLMQAGLKGGKARQLASTPGFVYEGSADPPIAIRSSVLCDWCTSRFANSDPLTVITGRRIGRIALGYGVDLITPSRDGAQALIGWATEKSHDIGVWKSGRHSLQKLGEALLGFWV